MCLGFIDVVFRVLVEGGLDEGLSALTPRVNDSSALNRVLRESARQSPERELLRRRLDGIGLRENDCLLYTSPSPRDS